MAGATISRLASEPGIIVHSMTRWSEPKRARIGLATYIDERDPLMIGAAWLLEQSGCER